MRREQCVTYGQYARAYNFLFGAIFERCRKAAAAAAEQIGGTILDVGVGTGLLLQYFGAKCAVVGVDLSEPMLREAQELLAVHKRSNVIGLVRMNAGRLGFKSESFDLVVAAHFLTTVAEPFAVLDEMMRVLKFGGELILVNYFGADNGPMRCAEKLFAPIAVRLGWDPTFRFRNVLKWARAHGGLKIKPPVRIPGLGNFLLVRITKCR